MPTTVTFHSGHETLEALLYRPPTGNGPWPAVVLGGGWCYVKELVQPTFAEMFAERGIVSLIFDYQTMGGSTGEPRQNINPWNQIEDYKNALSYVSNLSEVDSSRLGVWGISYSGGHVVSLAAHDQRVKAFASVVPVIDGYESMRLAHGTLGFRRLRQTVAEDRENRYRTGEYGYLPHNPEFEGAPSTWPFPTSRNMFEKLVALEQAPYEGRATIASTEWLLEYNVLPDAERVYDARALFVVAEDDDHTHWEIELDAFHRLPCPIKSLVTLEKTTHQSIYLNLEDRRNAATACADWFSQQLGVHSGS